ncbi:hypothetical protein RCC89_05595 [Cytophagaceae bacterium ABcell3]|nr:hypothetical protein RCC89_05595 [Cytophagaceae bacterium ABcell3]
MKKLRLKGLGKKLFIFGLVAIMIVPALISTAQDPAQVPQEQQLPEQPQVRSNFSDEELQAFADLYLKTADIQEKNQPEMIQAIENENINLERFNEILSNQLDPENIAADEKEMESFNKAFAKVNEVQKNVEAEISQLIEGDIGIEQYKEIVLSYQQHPEVQEKINSLLELKN